MNQSDLLHFKTLFTALKDQMYQKVTAESGETQVGAELNLNAGDIIDQSLNERDMKLKLKLMGRDLFFMKKIDQSLEKIENGTFGECEECGCDIGVKRLLARPIASHCINCKEEMERNEGHILYEKRSHTNGSEIKNIANAVFTSA